MMEPVQLFIIGILILLIYLVFAFSYHVYKLEILIRQFLDDKVDFDATIEKLEYIDFAMDINKCNKCNRNDNTCGCN